MILPCPSLPNLRVYSCSFVVKNALGPALRSAWRVEIQSTIAHAHGPLSATSMPELGDRPPSPSLRRGSSRRDRRRARIGLTASGRILKISGAANHEICKRQPLRLMKTKIPSRIFNCLIPSAVAFVAAMVIEQASADPYFFSTGSPDGLIATLSSPASAGQLETETADDFVTAAPTMITSATFTGLLPSGTPLSAVNQVEIELYNIFPLDSTFPPDGHVLTRANSPSDNNFAASDSNLGQLSFTSTLLNPSFTAANSVVHGINPLPNQFTGGEGPVTGEEVQFNITFNTPLTVQAGHFFFRPEVGLTNGSNFLWLSAPKPIGAGGTPFPVGITDLQTWIRNDGAGAIGPDWSRIGTDITHQGPFNAAFSLSGQTIPESGSSFVLLFIVLGVLFGAPKAIGKCRVAR